MQLYIFRSGFVYCLHDIIFVWFKVCTDTIMVWLTHHIALAVRVFLFASSSRWNINPNRISKHRSIIFYIGVMFLRWWLLWWMRQQSFQSQNPAIRLKSTFFTLLMGCFDNGKVEMTAYIYNSSSSTSSIYGGTEKVLHISKLKCVPVDIWVQSTPTDKKSEAHR